MSRMLLILLAAGVAVAVVALIVSVFAAPSAHEADQVTARRSGVQKVSYAVMLALMFAMAAGVLGDG